MFLASTELYLGVIKHQRRVVFVVAFVGKTYLYGLLTKVRIKQHLPLKSPFTYFIQIVIELSIRKTFAFLKKRCIICKYFTY